MQEKTIEVDGRMIGYKINGDGPAVVLLHGFGEDSCIWEEQYIRIRGFKFIIPDLPGSGKSEATEDMSLEGLASTLHHFLEKEFPGERPAMIGHSMGGYITLAYEELYPGYLKGFGLFHSTAFADSQEKKASRKKSIDFIEKNGPEEFLKTTISALYGPITKEERPELIEKHIQKSRNFSGAALVSYYVSMMKRPDRTKILQHSSNPVLIVLGQYDQAVPLEDGLKLAYMADISYIHVLDKSGHMGMKEEAEKANELLTNFLTRLLKTTKPE